MAADTQHRFRRSLRWKQLNDRTRQCEPLAERAAVSPSGLFVAYLLPRSGATSLEERESVRVEEFASGNVRAVLSGKDTVRGMDFLSDHKLVVVRDKKDHRGMQLQLFELPLGELIAETFLSQHRDDRMHFDHTPDGSGLLVLAENTPSQPTRRAYLIDGTTLDVRWEGTHPSGEFRLHPDGRTVAWADITRSGSDRYALRFLPEGDQLALETQPWTYDLRLRWTGPTTLTVLLDARGSNSVDPLQWFLCDRATSNVQKREAPWTLQAAPRVFLSDDGTRLVAIAPPKKSREPTQFFVYDAQSAALLSQQTITSPRRVHLRDSASECPSAWSSNGMYLPLHDNHNGVIFVERDGSFVQHFAQSLAGPLPTAHARIAGNQLIEFGDNRSGFAATEHCLRCTTLP